MSQTKSNEAKAFLKTTQDPQYRSTAREKQSICFTFVNCLLLEVNQSINHTLFVCGFSTKSSQSGGGHDICAPTTKTTFQMTDWQDTLTSFPKEEDNSAGPHDHAAGETVADMEVPP